MKYAWTGLSQDQAELAAYFRVSPAAMARRLIDLGLSEPHSARHLPQSIRHYFRQAPTRAPLPAKLLALR
jgi:Zn-dependent peptidase ImmA (M78 family)